MRDNDYRRQQGYNREFGNDFDRQGRNSENWGSNRQQGEFDSRGGQFSQSSQSDYNRWNDQGGSQNYRSDYGSQYGAGRSSGSGRYGQGGSDQYQDNRGGYGRQQESYSQGGGQYGAYSDRFNDDFRSRQQGESYGRGQYGGGTGQDRYSGGFYGDESRFGSGQQQGYRSGETHHDPDYHQWRSEQLRNLDSDYDAWRGERYKKFSEDFNDWRSKRTSQDSNTSKQAGSTSNKTKDQS